jgi:hypothetical protein
MNTNMMISFLESLPLMLFLLDSNLCHAKLFAIQVMVLNIRILETAVAKSQFYSVLYNNSVIENGIIQRNKVNRTTKNFSV